MPAKKPAFDPRNVPKRTASDLRKAVLDLLNIEVEELIQRRLGGGLTDEDVDKLDKYGRLVAALERQVAKEEENKSDEEILADVLSKLPSEVLAGELQRRRNGR